MNSIIRMANTCFTHICSITWLSEDVWSLTISGGTSLWSRVTPVSGGPSGRYSMVYGVMDEFLLVSHGEW